MNEGVEVSLVSALMVLVFEAVLLQEVLRRIVNFERPDGGSHHIVDRRLTQGTAAPNFSARILGTDHEIGPTDLTGQSSILLFVSPKDTASPLYDKLAVSSHALWHKAQGRLYLVCAGSDRQCLELIRSHAVEAASNGQVRVLIDENGAIAQRFLISSTPVAVLLDDQARVNRYGYPR